jgi:hypothetical protein
MMMVLKKFWNQWDWIVLFLAIAALVYLPNARRFGYFNDDWYLMYSANVAGPGVFADIYSIDRPARAFVMGPAYSLFGLDPFYYYLSALVFKVLAALSFLWILRTLWPSQSSAIFLAGLLLLVYPGFLSTPNAIDYQAQQVSFFLAFFSIALSLQAAASNRRMIRVVLWFVSMLTATAYLGLVEYFLGLEVLRLGVLGIYWMKGSWNALSQRCTRILAQWILFLSGSLGFLIWRYFFFESARKATDINTQLASLAESPTMVLPHQIVMFFQDSFEATFLAWGVPLTNVWATPLRLREMFLAGLLVACVVALAGIFLKSHYLAEEERTGLLWQKEAFWLGMTTVLAGFGPVVLSNRNADFSHFSRYMLASSPGVALLLVTLLYQINVRIPRLLLASLLLTTATLTHYLNGVRAAQETEAMQTFWWQVNWRIPQLEPGTTLVANYFNMPIEEDYFIWGPANLIYYPQSTDEQRLRPALWAAVLTRDTLTSIQTHEKPKSISRRSILTFMDYENILILTQPTSASCVQVIEGNLPVVSASEQYDIMLAADASDTNHILLGKAVPIPPGIIFGPQPPQGWCYFYEKASLAYQRGDLQSVIELGQTARKNGFSAGDPVEWMPFLQAAALAGDLGEINELAPSVKKSRFLNAQACQVLISLPELSDKMKSFVEAKFCTDFE